MSHIRAGLSLQLWRINCFRSCCPQLLRRFGSSACNRDTTHTRSDLNSGPKPRIQDYYSKKEIAALLFQPFFTIVAYLLVVWHLFKYCCNINSIEDFMKVLRWKYRNYRLSKEPNKGK